jgi:hypothetical protein
MPKIEQYSNYVDFYTKIIKTITLCILSLLRSTSSNRPPVHLYGSLFGSATTVCSCAVFLDSIEIQWRFVQTHGVTSDCIGQPGFRSE